LLGMKATAPLVKSLTTLKRDSLTVAASLKILRKLVRDVSLESQANSGYIINEENALNLIFECL
jgi:hypothetical protein